MTRARDVADTQDNLGGAVPPFVAGKNKIINGDFSNWQRGTTFSASGYTADRWNLGFGGTGASAVVTQQSFTPGTAPVAGYESSYFYQVATTSGSDAGTYITFEQRIEDVRTFAGQTITVSFWARATSGTPKVGLEVIQNPSGAGGTSVYGINSTTKTLSTSWARYSFTFAVPALTQTAAQTGPSNTSNIPMNFWLSNGSSLTARSGNPGLQTNTFQFWGMQAEVGSVATPFTTASGSIGGELALCQRYYQVVGAGFSGFNQNASYMAFAGTLAVPMRATPTLGLSSTALSWFNYGIGTTAVVISQIWGPYVSAPSGFAIELQIASGNTSTAKMALQMTNNYTASAEL